MKHTKTDLIILGGGAAGMMAAAAAAKKGAGVILLEQKELPGKKIPATGNGHCNFSNTAMEPECYRSDSGGRGFTAPALARFGPEDSVRFFASLGVQSTARDGCLYPRSLQAASVRRALASEAERLGVRFICGARATQISFQRPLFEMQTTAGDFAAKRCILAAGGCASPQLGSDGSGLLLAEKLGHTRIPPVPALVPLVSDARWLKSAKGVRARGRVTLLTGGPAQCDAGTSLSASGQAPSDCGELQFTEDGISGIPVFQVSRYAARALDRGIAVVAVLDLVPEFERDELANLLEETLGLPSCPDSAQEFFGGWIHTRLAAVLADRLHAKRLKLHTLSPEEKHAFAGLAAAGLKDIRIRITGTKGFSRAQVTAGGVSASEIDPETMQSLLLPGLYFAGELIDVDGPCGGYNLHWAFASGMLAGGAAAESLAADK